MVLLSYESDESLHPHLLTSFSHSRKILLLTPGVACEYCTHVPNFNVNYTRSMTTKGDKSVGVAQYIHDVEVLMLRTKT